VIDEAVDTDPLNSGPSFAVQVISSGVRPIIELDNSDKTRAELEATPNEFITEPTSKKIKNFRLRVLATHQSESIEQAVLEWEHPGTARSGKLAWSEFAVGDLGYVNTADKTAGHNGQWKNPANPLDGKFFVFNGNTGLTHNNNDNNGEQQIFTSSSEPYTLLITVYSQNGLYTLQKYTLYVDENGPTVNIRSVRGAYAEPAGDDGYYTVNGNILVSVDHSAAMGIMAVNNAPVVKWIVEEDKPGYLTAADTVLHKIKSFRANPSASGLQFFDAIGETPVSGWVQPGEISSFKLNTRNENANGFNLWNGEYLWLYIIGEDNIQNLNYIVRKLKVDDSTDKPGMDVGGEDFIAVNEGKITGQDKLLITYDADGKKVGNIEKNNILDNNQGIELSFTDDDGVSLDKGGVEITLKDLNTNAEKTLSIDMIKKAVNGKDYLETGSSMEWLGVLSQEIMAAALYGGQNPPKNLNDGFYWLKIKVTDNKDVKVAINGSRPGDTPVSAESEQEFYFAVQSQTPIITVEGIEENATKNKEEVKIKGTVKSRVKIQKLSITFNPAIDPLKLPSVKPDPAGGQNIIETDTIPLNFVNETWSTVEGTWVYTWELPGTVNFGPDNLFDSGAAVFDWRRFNLAAIDSLDSQSVLERTVQVDATPPEVALNEMLFNFGRLPNEDNEYVLNGKVPLVITAADLNGIAVEMADDGQGNLTETGNANVWWWALPKNDYPSAASGADGLTVTVTPFPGGGDKGLGGQFKTSDSIGGGNYRVYLDTRLLTETTNGVTYNIWAIAQDKSGNFNVIDPGKPLRTFTVDQSTDLPVLVKDSLLPLNGAVISNAGTLSISGKAFDDDGFDSAKLRNYLEICFYDGTGANGWSEWFHIPAGSVTGPDAAGEISFRLELTDTSLYGGYFAGQGEKRYRIRITDEAEASADGRNNPPGKNPDGINDISAAQSRYPGTAASGLYYSFYLKTKPPEILFSQNDPTSGHDNYVQKRPVFKTKEQLTAAISGSGAWVTDGYLDTISFTYNRPSDPGVWNGAQEIRNKVLVKITANANGEDPDPPLDGKYIWTLEPDWLQPFDKLSEGMQSVTIEAIDRAGNKTRVEYSFYKDETEPEISFTNVSDTDVRVISGAAGGVSIKGTFRDAYSNLAIVYGYHFEDGLEVHPETFPGAAPASSAAWEIKIPGSSFNDSTFPDGEHTLTVWITDALGTLATKTATFIVDRSSPDITQQKDIRVLAGSGNNRLVMEDEYTRVFSAANYNAGDETPAFKLSGLIYEHNLKSLNADIFANPEITSALKLPEVLDNIDQHNFTDTPTYTNGNLSIRQAADNDIGTDPDGKPWYVNIGEMSAHNAGQVYVWTLTITKDTVAKLLNNAQNVDGSPAIRRQIVLNAADLAGKTSSRETWRFFLDSVAPRIEYFNLHATSETAPVTLSSQTVSLLGTVTDSTNVKEIRYRVAKYNYASSAVSDIWDEYYTSNDPADWPDLLDTIKTSVSWTVNNTELNKNPPYPQNMLSGDGKYKLELYTTDYSLNEQLVTAGNKIRETRIFFIDRNVPYTQETTPRKEYYSGNANNGDNGNITFTYTVSDDNGIAGVTAAAVLVKTGTTQVTVPPTNIVCDRSSTNPNDTQNTVTVTLKNMASDTGKCTLTLTVTDQAGQSADNIIEFNLDNTPPEIQIPVNDLYMTVEGKSADNTLTGRVKFTGSFLKDNTQSPVERVAFYVANSSNNFAAPGDITSVMTMPPTALDAELNLAGWHFNTGLPGSDPWKLEVGSRTLVEIEQGASSAVITMPNTRYFNNSQYWQPVTNTVGGTYTFNGEDIPAGENIYKITVYFFAIDQAGNRSKEPVDFLIYPAGDIPQIDSITSPKKDAVDAERMMNGRIRISGTAKDNVYVKNVWFRVYRLEKNSANADLGYATNLQIPVWNEETWEPKTGTGAGNQSPKIIDLNNDGDVTNDGGWYMANGGGSSNVSWWAYINTEGELDATRSNSARIRIEVIAEDSTWLDTGDGGWDPSEGLYTSTANTSEAIVVSGAPRFEDELVLNDTSASQPDFTRWGSITTTSMKGRSAYAIHVKHTWGIGKIVWNNINLLDETHVYNTTTYNSNIGLMDATNPTGPGIAVKAQPKELFEGTLSTESLYNLSLSKGTYMIWNPGDWSDYSNNLKNKLGNDSNQNKNSTTFTVDDGETIEAFVSTLTSTPSTILRLMKMNGDYFEWIVIVDIHADILKDDKNQGFVNQARPYTLELSAEETSKVIPLASSSRSDLPIDNLPPDALYTLNTSVVGSAVTFGGEAGDDGQVRGLSRVVLWFSRKGGANISWLEQLSNGTPDKTFQDGTFVDSSNSTIKNLPDAGITLPLDFYNDNTNADDNWSSIVIDRNDPRGSQKHHGHQVRMGWATVGGKLGTAWYVVLDSTRIKSGQVTAHFIVYDKAGNARYGSRDLWVLNNVPKIKSITLGTAIRGDYPNLQTAMGGGTGNVTFTSDATSGAMDIIRTQLQTVSGITANSDDSLKGISKPISINTGAAGTLGPVYDDPFTVRNGLLAIQVQIDNGYQTGKERHFRVEYVNDARPITGAGDLTKDDNSGIKAGKAYIIENPGGDAQNKFPWGIFGAKGTGAQGDTFTKGQVFLATEDGKNVTLPADAATYGSPSVWELNSNPSSYPAVAKIDDVEYGTSNSADNWAKSAEFVYRNAAFGESNAIRDFNPQPADLRDDGRPKSGPYFPSFIGTGVTGVNPTTHHSMFIIRVFDSDSGNTGNNSATDNLFGDFALLSIWVNNNDKTRPYAQLYDLNPKTEDDTSANALKIDDIGGNRTKSGLYTDNSKKSGHIEPRTTTHLSSAQMGGAANAASASITKPYLAEADKAAKLFATDTVSGDVILRGYAEDNQMVQSVNVNIGGTTVDILTRNTSGFGMQAAEGRTKGVDVDWIETVDLERHRVEWAYLWKTETTPGGSNVVGSVTVSAAAYNGNRTLDKKTSSEPVAKADNATDADYQKNITHYNDFNPDYETGMPRDTNGTLQVTVRRYNQITVNLRPYITGFLRNSALFAHNPRSRQGRYMFARNETAVVKGFNLGGVGNTVISLSTANTAAVGTANIAAITGVDTGTTLTAGNQAGSFGITDNDLKRYRIFTVNGNQGTGAGVVTLTVNNYSAVNTRPTTTPSGETTASLRPYISTNRPYILPWNIEYSAGTDGSELWDDFTQVHIWQSNDTATANNTENGRFAKTDGWTILNPSMSIDPANGTLYESHIEGGQGTSNTGNSSAVMASDITIISVPGRPTIGPRVMQWGDPIYYSDVYRSPGGGGTGGLAADTWAVASLFGRGGQNREWTAVGGVYLSGPGGSYLPVNQHNGTSVNNPTNQNLYTGVNSNVYHVESTWYNVGDSSTNADTNKDNTDRGDVNMNGGAQNPPTTNQFINPHIVTSYSGTGNNTLEHIHVSYYDSKDGSIKYRYNRRGEPNAIHGGAINNSNDGGPPTTIRNPLDWVPKLWTNLDGGLDLEDVDATGGQTTWTLAQATRRNAENNRYNNDGIAGDNRYLRDRYVTNNNTLVIAGQQIYRFGNNANTAGNTTVIYAPVSGRITGLLTNTSTTNQTANSTTIFTITPESSDNFTAQARVVNYTERSTQSRTQRINAGKHNSIAVTSDGYPVIAYYDETNQRLKLAVSDNVRPIAAANWKIIDNVIPSGNLNSFGTGEFVSMKIDTKATIINGNGQSVANPDLNRVHIAAMNTNKRLVYVSGFADFTTGTFTNPVVQVVDSVGNVGRWCALSLDADGNPWISYMDESYIGSRDGVKVAYLNKTTFYKGVTGSGHFPGKYTDLFGASLEGWETMHVPTTFRVENPVEGGREHGRLGMECFPTRNVTPTLTQQQLNNWLWSGAVGYLSPDYYRVAYYVK
jgi:hypothetical protein